MSPEVPVHEVRIVEFPETVVAVFRHRGDPARLDGTIRRFVEWRKEQGLTPSRSSATFNILYDDPESVPPESWRIDLCAGVLPETDTGRCGILFETIPAGRCAVLRYTGSDDRLGECIRYLVNEWFPASGERKRNFRMFLQRVRFFPEVAAEESVVDIFLPIA